LRSPPLRLHPNCTRPCSCAGCARAGAPRSGRCRARRAGCRRRAARRGPRWKQGRRTHGEGCGRATERLPAQRRLRSAVLAGSRARTAAGKAGGACGRACAGTAATRHSRTGPRRAHRPAVRRPAAHAQTRALGSALSADLNLAPLNSCHKAGAAVQEICGQSRQPRSRRRQAGYGVGVRRLGERSGSKLCAGDSSHSTGLRSVRNAPPGLGRRARAPRLWRRPPPSGQGQQPPLPLAPHALASAPSCLGASVPSVCTAPLRSIWTLASWHFLAPPKCNPSRQSAPFVGRQQLCASRVQRSRVLLWKSGGLKCLKYIRE